MDLEDARDSPRRLDSDQSAVVALESDQAAFSALKSDQNAFIALESDGTAFIALCSTLIRRKPFFVYSIAIAYFVASECKEKSFSLMKVPLLRKESNCFQANLSHVRQSGPASNPGFQLLDSELVG